MVETKGKLIQKLVAREGNRYAENKETVATYGRSIVFLPQGVDPGKEVRVELRPLTDRDGKERVDGRGRVMYRAVPAPIEYIDRWQDNGDGTLSRVTYSLDWRLKETQEGVSETRPIAKREGTAGTRSALKIVWGGSLATSIVEESHLRMIPLEEERVENHALLWQRVSERTEPLPVEQFVVTTVTVDSGDWYQKRLEPAYQDGTSVSFRVGFRRPNTTWDTSHSDTSTWAAMPQWWRDEQEKLYVVCPCGRRRIGSSPDTYQSCQICRSEEYCGRCGQQGVVKLVGADFICPTCELMASQEALVREHVSDERRVAIVAEVEKLLGGKVIEGEGGELVLAATVDHLPDGYTKDQLLEKFKGYLWYYFAGDGVYGSRFSPDALEVLRHYDAAMGNGLVRITAWLAGDEHQAKDRWGEASRQFYFVTQVRGEEATPSLTERDLGKLSIAIRLRGSEAMRQEAIGRLELVRRVSEKRASPIEKIIENAEGDYAQAIKLISEIEALLARQEAGEVLVDFGGYFRIMGSTGNANYWVIRADGSLRDPDETDGRRRYESSEGEKRWHIVEGDELAISWSKANTAASHEFKVHRRPATLTLEQTQTVARLEDEIAQSWQGRVGCAGTETPGIGEGWNSELGHRPMLTNRLNDIRLACGKSRVLKSISGNLTLAEVSSSNGQWVSSDEIRGRVWDHINWAKPFDIKIGRRDNAQVVETITAGNGVVEVLAIEPERDGDHPRFHLRWRQTSEGSKDSTPSASGGPDDRLLPQAIELAQTAERLVGREQAKAAFERELHAEYGRARRQAALEEAIPGFREDPAGERFLSLGRARDVDELLADALAWWKHQPTQTQKLTSPPAAPAKPKAPSSPTAKPASDAEVTSFLEKFGGNKDRSRRK